MDSFEPDDSGLPSGDFQVPALRPKLPVKAIVVVVVAAGLALALVLYADAVFGWLRGENDLLGERCYEPPHEVDGERLAGLDWVRIHARLWQDWTIAFSQVAHDERLRPAEQAAFDALLAGFAGEANLAELLTELRELLGHDMVREAARIDYVTWAYNRYLEDNGVGWRVDGVVRSDAQGAFFYIKTYRVLANVAVIVDEDEYRAQLLNRADSTNVVERYLGAAREHSEAALVIIDRVGEFAVNRVWPLLDEATWPGLSHGMQGFAAAILAEVSTVLSPRALATLRASAQQRHWLVGVADSVQARHVCGSDFVIAAIPARGFPPEDHEYLRSLAARSMGQSCPSLTPGEAEIAIAASNALTQVDELEEALAELVAWMSRGITVHEIQHLVDQAEHNVLEDELPCDACPPNLSAQGRVELSAYLTSFTAPDVGYAALLQACEVLNEPGPNGEAVMAALAALMPGGCQGGPPPDLYEQAAALTQRLFGDRAAIVLPEDFPRRLTLIDLWL